MVIKRNAITDYEMKHNEKILLITPWTSLEFKLYITLNLWCDDKI